MSTVKRTVVIAYGIQVIDDRLAFTVLLKDEGLHVESLDGESDLIGYLLRGEKR
jgi:hypothetical protein